MYQLKRNGLGNVHFMWFCLTFFITSTESRTSGAMAFKRSAVRSRLSPPLDTLRFIFYSFSPENEYFLCRNIQSHSGWCQQLPAEYSPNSASLVIDYRLGKISRLHSYRGHGVGILPENLTNCSPFFTSLYKNTRQ